jgi:hypothetical protein
MKKKSILWSILLIIGTMTACTKAESPVPTTDAGAKYKKGGNAGPSTPTGTTTYGGQATGLNATVWNTQNFVVTSNQTILAQTTMLPATGGSLTASHTAAYIAGVFTADALSASVTGQGNTTTSTASATNVNITVGGNVITASQIQSTASTGCGAIPTGSTQITSLVVNGTAITVTGAPSQAIYLPGGGMVIINEHIGSKKGSSIIKTVTALRVILPNATDMSIATSRAEIKC